MFADAPDCSRTLKNIRHVCSKVLVVKAMIVPVEDKLRGHISSESTDGCADVDGRPQGALGQSACRACW